MIPMNYGALTAAIFLFVCGLSRASATEFILCKHPGAHDVVITLDDRVVQKRSLSCISGDFIADMTPCAPNDGYGISAPTGSAPLGDIVDRWQDLAGQYGGVAGFSISNEQIDFTGGFASSGDYEELWSFRVNRLTGEGVLRIPKSANVTFDCKKKNQVL